MLLIRGSMWLRLCTDLWLMWSLLVLFSWGQCHQCLFSPLSFILYITVRIGASLSWPESQWDHQWDEGGWNEVCVWERLNWLMVKATQCGLSLSPQFRHCTSLTSTGPSRLCPLCCRAFQCVSWQHKLLWDFHITFTIFLCFRLLVGQDKMLKWSTQFFFSHDFVVLYRSNDQWLIKLRKKHLI